MPERHMLLNHLLTDFFPDLAAFLPCRTDQLGHLTLQDFLLVLEVQVLGDAIN